MTDARSCSAFTARTSGGGVTRCDAGARSIPCRFTLLELLAVLGIIALLAGMLLPAIAGARRKARMTECMSQQHQIGVALHSYANDYSDCLPSCGRLGPDTILNLPALNAVLNDYAGGQMLFNCPGDRASPSLFDTTGISYEWNSFVNGKKIDRASMSIIGLDIVGPVLGDAEAFHRKAGRNYLYIDGRVTQSLELLIRGP